MDLSALSLNLSGQAPAFKSEGKLRADAGAMPANPFVGLRPFNTNESLLFFGRRNQTIELLERLHRTRFLAVVGSSGCGKSSLIRAGLIPKLKAGFLVEDRDRWLFATMKPGDAPIHNLAQAIIEAISEKQSEAEIGSLVETIQVIGAQAMFDLLAPALEASDANLLLLVDQFEEIFRFGLRSGDEKRRDEAADFVSIMLALADQQALPIYVVMTMRSDFLGDCDNFFGLPEAMNRSQYLVPRLARQQRREAIEGPAMLFGGQISPRLLDRVLNDVGEESDQLPIMQHALMRTWENWLQNRAGQMDLANYEAVGTIKEALSRDADKALEGMSDEELQIAEGMFRALTDTDFRGRRIRRPAHLSEIQAITGASRESVLKIVKRFQSDGRTFLNVSQDRISDDPLIDISHESLIRQWKHLRDWVDKEAKSRAMYLRVIDTALRHKAGQAKLWGNPDLQIALCWRNENKPNEAWAARYSPDFNLAMAFLDRSRRKRRFLLSLLAFLLLVLAAVVSFDIWQRHEARVEEARKDADAQAAEAKKDAEKAKLAIEVEQRIRIQAEKDKNEAEKEQLETAEALLENKPVPFTFEHKVVGEVRFLRFADGRLSLLDNWVEKNIIPVEIPELREIENPVRGPVRFYIGAADQLKAVFKEIKARGLLGRVLTWDSAFVESSDRAILKYIRGEGPSPHSLGIACDINKRYNPPGRPMPQGEKGSVRELLPIFREFGFTWGGNFDPSHFQVNIINKTGS